MVDTCIFCTGICDDRLVTLATSGNRCEIFKDRQGNVKARKVDGDTIRPTNCSGVVQGNPDVLCGVCMSYRHSLLAMLSKEQHLPTSTEPQPPEKSRTQVNSHCPWKHLSERNSRIEYEIALLTDKRKQGKLHCWKQSSKM